MWRSMVLVADLICLSFLLLMLNYFLVQHLCSSQRDLQSFIDASQFSILSPRKDKVIPHIATTSSVVDNKFCSMGSCFDVARCRGGKFKVYVYPSQDRMKRSELFEKILSTIRSSPFVTSDPEEACLFVPSIDVLDRDVHSKDFVKNLPSFNSLSYWNDGRNHLLFVQYSGTWPKYSEPLDFSTGQAILATASFNVSLYRTNFDISLPLMHKKHPDNDDRSGVLSRSDGCGLFPIHRKYLLGFKGKRYLYGEGSGIRSSLYHIHNGRDVVMLTTCKHNQDWVKYTDERCHSDNLLYERYDYEDLMRNSSFCLIPRGRRLGSYRFLEALQASCIPVSLSNGYVLPFHEVVDWRKAAIIIDERQLLQMVYILRRIPDAKLLDLRLNTQFIWESYFSSVNKIITTTFQIIRGRIFAQPDYLWNTPPHPVQLHTDFSPYPSDYPHHGFNPDYSLEDSSRPQFTVTISTSRSALRESSPLIKLVHVLSKAPNLAAVIILWVGSGQPQVIRTKFPVHTTVMVVKLDGHMTDSLWLVNTTAILHLNEDVFITSDEAEFGFFAWQAFPSRLVGFIGHSHLWDSVRRKWAYSARPHNYVSMVTTDALFYHKYYGYLLANSLSDNTKRIADHSLTCLTIILNFLVAQYAQAPPLTLPWTRHAPSYTNSLEVAQERVACLNMAANAFGYMPLIHSHVRLDPVLYRDNVSMLRKEYRKMEATGS